MPPKRSTVVLERVGKTATMFRVPLTMELDDEPRTVPVPEDLGSALAEDPDAEAAFTKLSFTHRREYVEWVEEAKRPETRARRIADTVVRARAGGPAR